MFTGIIEKVIRIDRIKREGKSVSIHLQLPFDVKESASIAVNGVCLTVESISGRISILRAVEETLRKTNLSQIRSGDWVNIERALRVGDSINGHFVYGHIDGMGKLLDIKKEPQSTRLRIGYPAELSRFIARKGSIAIDGISLTVVEVSPSDFLVVVIPYTMENTNLKYKKRGEMLNIEIDPIARYIEKFKEATNE